MVSLVFFSYHSNFSISKFQEGLLDNSYLVSEGNGYISSSARRLKNVSALFVGSADPHNDRRYAE